jgi:hypothetical protein
MLKMSKNRAILHAQMCSGERVAAVVTLDHSTTLQCITTMYEEGDPQTAHGTIKVQLCEFKVILQAWAY